VRDYLVYLREQMGRAVEDLVPFKVAYARTDWNTKTFPRLGRRTGPTYNTYLLLERESLGKQ
jgi:hypothetical protein